MCFRNSPNVVTISCSEEVTFVRLEPGDIKVSITGPLAPYDFEFTVNESTGFEVGKSSKTFEIHLTYKTSLAGGDKGKYISELLKNTETINIVFNQAIMVDRDGNKLVNSQTATSSSTPTEVLTPQQQEAAETQATVGVTSIFITFGTALIIVFLLGKSLHCYSLNYGMFLLK